MIYIFMPNLSANLFSSCLVLQSGQKDFCFGLLRAPWGFLRVGIYAPQISVLNMKNNVTFLKKQRKGGQMMKLILIWLADGIKSGCNAFPENQMMSMGFRSILDD